MVEMTCLSDGMFLILFASLHTLQPASCVWVDLLNQYSRLQAPSLDQGGSQSTVKVRVTIDNVRPKDTRKLELEWIYYIHLTWFDHRLMESSTTNESLLVSGNHVSTIWRPDIHVSNSLDNSMHDGLGLNTGFKIFRNGTVLWKSKMSTVVRCPNAGETYPLDTYICTLQFQSFTLPNGILDLQWDENRVPLKMQVYSSLASYSIESATHDTRTDEVDSEIYSSLHIRIIIKRLYKMYLVQVYMPSAMLVVLSWLSFWIDRDAILARVSLGSLCVVSIITQSTGLMNVVPEVSGVRAVEVWESFCITMIFLAMLEFATMHFMCRMKKKHDQYKRISNNRELDSTDEKKTEPSIGRYIGLIRFRIDPAKIDHVARIAFPVVFVLFNIIYWPVHASQN